MITKFRIGLHASKDSNRELEEENPSLTLSDDAAKAVLLYMGYEVILNCELDSNDEITITSIEHGKDKFIPETPISYDYALELLEKNK